MDQILAHRQALLRAYEDSLEDVADISSVGAKNTDRTHAAWMCTVLIENRRGLQIKLQEHGIESAQVHYRNDRYSIFGRRQEDYPNMDAVEDKYLMFPLHTRMDLADVDRVCAVIRGGW